jgi:hypothetical protein
MQAAVAWHSADVAGPGLRTTQQGNAEIAPQGQSAARVEMKFHAVVIAAARIGDVALPQVWLDLPGIGDQGKVALRDALAIDRHLVVRVVQDNADDPGTEIAAAGCDRDDALMILGQPKAGRRGSGPGGLDREHKQDQAKKADQSAFAAGPNPVMAR